MSNFLYDAYAVLGKIYNEKAYIKQALSETPCDPANKPLTVKTVYGVVENDAFLELIIKQNTQKPPKQAIKIILKEALYLIKFAGKAPYAVTNEAVSLVKKLGKGGVSGFVNAFLRKAVKVEPELPKSRAARLAALYSYPEFAVKILLEYYGLEECEKIISYRSDLQYLRFAKQHVKIAKNQSDLAPTVFENVFGAKGRTMDEGFHFGEYTFQSIGSVAVCDIIEPCKSVLDACAAPGGKSVYLAEKCEKVTSFELHPHRTELIESYKRRMQAENITIICKDSTIFEENFQNMFDAVLCDVPCSGLGVAHENPDIKLRRTQADIAPINKTQKAILSVCSSYVKPGGYLYYSTCSILPQENEGIIEAFIKDNSNFEAVAADSALSHIKTKNGIQFLPHISDGAGFYVCKMRKKV